MKKRHFVLLGLAAVGSLLAVKKGPELKEKFPEVKEKCGKKSKEVAVCTKDFLSKNAEKAKEETKELFNDLKEHEVTNDLKTKKEKFVKLLKDKLSNCKCHCKCDCKCGCCGKERE